MDINNNVGICINHNSMQLTSNPANRGTRDLSFFRPLIGWEKLENISSELQNHNAKLILGNHVPLNKSQNSITFGIGSTFSLSGGFTIKIGSEGFELIGDTKTNMAGRIQAEQYRDFLDKMIRYANGQINHFYLFPRDIEEATRDVLKKLSEFGIDTSKDFTINGTLFTVQNGIVDKKSAFDAQAAFEMQIANNRTYTFADEKTKAWIHHLTEYYFRNAPEDVKKSFYDTMEKTGINPFPDGYSGAFKQLSVEQDFATFGNDDIIGSSVESAVIAVRNILERIANPIITEKDPNNIEMLKKEETFYQALLAALLQ
ncbi:MAG: hypothetical protein FWG91_05310 [Lachnospiraceae bacterium]|nr:hypothetical protein [Lachnospiraceae bacterium]